MARQTSITALEEPTAHWLGSQWWHPKKPNPKIRYRDMDLPWLNNVVRWLKAKREAAIAESHAAASYCGGSDSMGSMYADQAADDYSRKAARMGDHIELIERYVLWREENGHVFHAPKPKEKVT